MRPTDLSHTSGLRRAWPVAAVALFLLSLLAWRIAAPPASAPPLREDAAPHPAGPPWHHGAADARFTLTLYADLECPFCKAYYPSLAAWVSGHPETVLQWHHLPLPAHEPIATQQAQLAECAAETGGHAAFFEAIAWIYQHTRGDGQGLPADARYPGLTAAVQACLDSDRPAAIVQAQAGEGTRDGIAATPTLRLSDRETGKSLLLHGPVEGDALLSALDLLAAGEEGLAPDITAMPADAVGDMPR